MSTNDKNKSRNRGCVCVYIDDTLYMGNNRAIKEFKKK